MIIVEGADNTGKTTLIQQLIEMDSRLHVLKRKKFRPGDGGSIGQSYLDMLASDTDGFGIADRCLASECIYGKIFRNGCRMTPQEHFSIRATLLSVGAVVVWCDPPLRVVQSSWQEREQLYGEYLPVHWGYKQWLVKIFSPLDIWHYDWTRPDAYESRAALLKLHARRQEQYSLALENPLLTCEVFHG